MKTGKRVLGGAVWVSSAVALALVIAGARPARAADDDVQAAKKWVIHEWGTFTSLQDEAGNAVGGINTDDEPLPPFVHRLSGALVPPPTEVPPSIFVKGVPGCHEDVTMRLETPVLYFHPPTDLYNGCRVKMTAQFRGGWLTEYYPDAEVEAPGVAPGNRDIFGRLSSSTVGRLAWTNLEVGGGWHGPETTEHVWTAPRAVKAADVRTADGEAERFLFYRGVAHIDAPLRVVQDAADAKLFLKSQLPPELAGQGGLELRALWLVDIRTDGRVAFRTIPSVDLDAKGSVLAAVSSDFERGDYRPGNLAKLRASLADALVKDGLFADEAQALLNTWELSYFKSPGLRLFFLVPQSWTDHYLPLTVSMPANINRVMVGRIELVTAQQRTALRQMAGIMPEVITNDAVRLTTGFFTALSNKSKSPAAETRNYEAVSDGRVSLAGFGVSVPKSYQLYLSLGRFRNALILDEEKKRPSPGIASMISAYRLEGYTPIEMSSAPAENAFSTR